MSKEGSFDLYSTAGLAADKSSLWEATGYVFAADEIEYLARVHVGGFISRHEAEAAAIQAARLIAQGLPASDSVRARLETLLRIQWAREH
ncbi:hypothetical protein GCM10007235_33000 [Pseudoxanthomonas indica]|nr:hypothetical protein GCM10007235_33000 [Pseudoxanthomonas indica]